MTTLITLENFCSGGGHCDVVVATDTEKHVFHIHTDEALQPLDDGEWRQFALLYARSECSGKSRTEAREILKPVERVK